MAGDGYLAEANNGRAVSHQIVPGLHVSTFVRDTLEEALDKLQERRRRLEPFVQEVAEVEAAIEDLKGVIEARHERTSAAYRKAVATTHPRPAPSEASRAGLQIAARSMNGRTMADAVRKFVDEHEKFTTVECAKAVEFERTTVLGQLRHLEAVGTLRAVGKGRGLSWRRKAVAAA